MTQPYDVNNERAVLAGVLQDRDIRRKVCGFLEAREFVGKEHRAIYKAVLSVGDETVLDTEILLLCDDSKDLERGLIDDLFTKVEAPKNIDKHMLRVREDYRRACNMGAVEILAATLKDRSIPYSECVTATNQILSSLSDVGLDPRTGKALSSQYLETLQERRQGKCAFVSTGYESLDSMLTEGFAKGRMTVLCGRPRNGKSSLVADMVNRMLKCEPKPRILVMPLEAGKERFIDMLVCNATGITISQLVKEPETLTTAQFEEVRRNVEKAVATDDRLVVMSNPFFGIARWTDEAAMEKTEEIYATGGYDVVITDLWARKLPNADKPDVTSKALFREQWLCQKYRVNSIAVHQLSRKVEERRDKRPELTDLKGSGAWEEAADLVLAVHREKVYKPFLEKDTVEVHVLKQKLGDAGMVMEARYHGGLFKLTDDRVQTARKKERARFAAEEDE